MNIDDTLRNFLSGFSGRIKNAGGFTEIYHAFSELDNDSKWIDQCHQNMIEMYLGARHLIRQMENNEPPEEIWPTLDDFLSMQLFLEITIIFFNPFLAKC